MDPGPYPQNAEPFDPGRRFTVPRHTWPTFEANGLTSDVEAQLLRLLATLKRAVADGVGSAPSMHAMRNVIGQMFASIELIDRDINPFGSGKGARDGIHPIVTGPDLEVAGGRCWLYPKLRWSAVDAATFKPTGQLTPVPPSPQYPNGWNSGRYAGKCSCRLRWQVIQLVPRSQPPRVRRWDVIETARFHQRP